MITLIRLAYSLRSLMQDIKNIPTNITSLQLSEIVIKMALSCVAELLRTCRATVLSTTCDNNYRMTLIIKSL